LAPGSLATLPLDLPGGFTAGGLTVVAADDVTGRRPAAAAGRPAAAGGAGALLSADLRLDDHVVHIDHGVGLLRGLETVAEREDARGGEYLVLEYAGGGRKLVPVLEMDRVWRYGSEEAGVSLDRPDGGAWQARRLRVEAEVAASAEALAGLARERAAREAPALKPPPKDYDHFVARFPYAETEDQARAIEATLADLARGSPPMDRLVCGDVGFGKTEVALRAAAVAAMAGRQVAVLAPTTVLVRQHLETFRKRFAGLGIRVEQLSRLARAKEANAVRAGLADGSVRIVVGTHALASPGVRFRDLGLLVIDEEQRFGARHKAALRQLREASTS
jgi:transcription-repair coupling factor (superfamily II helicase)